MLYTALIADVIDSTKLTKADRDKVQIFIRKCLSCLNSVFKPSLTFEVVFSAGDEVQGLFKSPASALLYLRLLRLFLSPIQIRCGIGAGQWNVRIPNGTSNEQDGSAYHNARDAILFAHKRKDCNIFFKSDNENNIYINTLINTSDLLIQMQSQYQNMVLLLTELMVPLFDREAMDINAFSQVFSLLKYKAAEGIYSNIYNKTENRYNLLNDIPVDYEPFFIFSPTIFDNEFVLASTLKKGLSTKISNITHTSRQNIDNVIRNGSIAAIRNVDAAALLFVHKIFVR